MLTIPPEAEQLIAINHLGTPKKVYTPPTTTSIIIGAFLIAFACAWIVIALAITGIPLMLENQASNQFSIPNQPSPGPTPVSPFVTFFSVLSLAFPCFGLIFVVAGCVIIVNALLNRRTRAVLCEYGVVQLARTGADAFRWEQVATVLDKVNVHTTHTMNQPATGISNTSTSISHTYTVACKDGRRFLFNRRLGNVEQLGQEIQIAVALAQQSA